MNALLSEWFFSVQGEGISTGVPSLFIRFPGCNLLCGGHMGKAMKEGRATWWCDTETQWMKGHDVLIDEILSSITPKQKEALADRRAHIVFTGGEPCMAENTKQAIILEGEFKKFLGFTPFIEIETNGTISSSLIDIAHQINCSPKLSNSGMPRAMRIKPDVLREINSSGGNMTQFKFVVSNELDIHEVMTDFVLDIGLPKEKIVLMPGVDKRDDLAERTRFVWEAAVELGLRMCTRLHILCYDKTVGV